jgi:hypothetical protein
MVQEAMANYANVVAGRRRDDTPAALLDTLLGEAIPMRRAALRQALDPGCPASEPWGTKSAPRESRAQSLLLRTAVELCSISGIDRPSVLHAMLGHSK